MKKDLNKLNFVELQEEVAALAKMKEKIVKPKRLTFCIVRTYSAGVFAGMFDRKNKDKQGTVFDAIRIHYWDGAASLSQMANEGVKKPQNCRFAQPVPEVDLREIIEVIPTTKEAEKNIKGVQVWKK